MSGLIVPLRNPKGTSTTTWLTPRKLVEALGPFDLDPATPQQGMPWKTAERMLRPSDDGLATPWPKESFVFHNPPYGEGMDRWMAKAADHGNGITLIFARVETGYFFESVWRHPNTSGLFFFESRLKFSNAEGETSNTAASPSVAIAYGARALSRMEYALRRGEICGRLIRLGSDQADVWQLGRKEGHKEKRKTRKRAA